MNPNLVTFARGARPGIGPAPMLGRPAMPPGAGMQPTMPQRMPPPVTPRGMPPFDPSRVIRPVDNQSIQQAAAAGRGGDSMMAHMTPGEIAVPPQVQTPEVLAALDRAFVAKGANPTSYQAGNPDQRINPDTGAPEFGFFSLDSLLPIALAIGASAFLGPEVLAPFLAEGGASGLGLDLATAGIAGGAIGGGLGTTAGNLIGGKDIGESLGRGAIGAVGSGVGGAIGNAFGTGPVPMPTDGAVPTTMAPAAGFDSIYGATNGAQGATLGQQGGALDVTTPVAAAAPKSSIFASLISKQGIGSGLGGALGGAVADDLYAKPAKKLDNGPPLLPAKPLSNYIGSGYGTPVFPDEGYLKNYGQRKEWNYYPNG
jgi:hypothetical protein